MHQRDQWAIYPGKSKVSNRSVSNLPGHIKGEKQISEQSKVSNRSVGNLHRHVKGENRSVGQRCVRNTSVGQR